MDFSNKTSLFDLVSMIIPGYTLIFSLSKILNIGELDSSGVAIVPILAASYIVGMIIHHLSKLIFDRIFRDDTELMKTTRKEVYEKRYGKNFTILSIEEKNIINTFYDKYYKVIDRYKHTNIRILEAQFSFIRSMIFVLPFLLTYVISNLKIDHNSIILKIGSLIIITLIGVIAVIGATKENKQNKRKNENLEIITTIAIIAGVITTAIATIIITLIKIMVGIEAIKAEEAIKSTGATAIFLGATTIAIAIITVISKVIKAILTKEERKEKEEKFASIITITDITAIIVTLVIILTIVTINTDIECDSWLWITITSVVVNTTLASWILPTINRQIYKSVWEDELYTRDLDK